LASAESLRLDVVNCGNRLSCGLAALLLPKSAFLDQWEMQFDNPSAAEAKLIQSALVVLGEKTRFQLSSDQLTLPANPQRFPAQEIGSLPVTLKRATMAPDHYVGSVYLTLEGAQDRLNIPVDMNVRTGPLWPLVAILAGIILGRLVKYMQERGGPQAAKLAEVNRLEMTLNQAHDEDGAILGPQVAAVRSKVYRYELDTVTEDLKTIEARLETLAQLRDMEHDLSDEAASPDKATALRQIAEAREQVAGGRDPTDLVAEIKQALEQLKQGLIAKGLPDAGLQHALKTVEKAETAAGKAKASLESVGTVSRGLRWIRNTLFALSGLSEELRAEATLWIVRPLLYFVLLFGLVAVGLSTLYVNTGLTFGAAPFADYFGLVLWGLSADVAGRTLSNLQGTSA
jgi:hypothetical protein